LNIYNIKSSDPSFSTQQNTYNVCVVAGIPEGMYSRFLEKQFTLFSGREKKRRKRQNDRAYSWLDTGVAIKSGRIKLVLCAQINLFYKFNLVL
jgi:hypothetical protein